MIQLKRAYDLPEETDGRRFLVDRLWPRGVKKEDLKLAGWVKDLSPSNDLRRWYHQNAEQWLEFERRYRTELEQKTEVLHPLLDAVREDDVTLVYSSRNERHNNAVVLKAYLEELLTR